MIVCLTKITFRHVTSFFVRWPKFTIVYRLHFTVTISRNLEDIFVRRLLFYQTQAACRYKNSRNLSHDPDRADPNRLSGLCKVLLGPNKILIILSYIRAYPI